MKRTILIILSVLAMGLLIFYFGFKVKESKYSEFKENGYIISRVYDKEGNFTKSEKYYFNQGEKYKKNYTDKIMFKNVNKEESKVSQDSFIHYDNGSLSVLKKSAILNLEGMAKDKPIKYYNIYEDSILEKTNNIYSIKNIKTKIDFSNFIMKINDNKYIIVGANLKLDIGGKERIIENSYYEIEYIEGDIVRIENNEASYQNVPTDIKIELANGLKLDLGTKFLIFDEQEILNLNQMTIDSDDNIELIPETKKEETKKEEENKKNPISGIGNGTINSANKNDGEEVNENTKELDPQFLVTDMSVTSNKFRASVKINDSSSLLNGDIFIKIIESNTNKIVYQIKEVQGTMNLNIEAENLSPETSYIFVVSSSYTKGGNTYKRDFIQKSFITESVGIDINKDYFTSNTLSFMVTKKSYSKIKAFDATLLDMNDKIIKTIKIDFDLLKQDSTNFMFDNLANNTTYKLRITNYLYTDSIITDSYINDQKYKTLRVKPTIGNNSFTINKKSSSFTLKLNNIKDPDNGIKSFRYEIYDARAVSAQPIQVVEKKSNSSVDVLVDEATIFRGLPYTFKVIALFDDNEKEYEYETELSAIMKLDGVSFPIVKFDPQEITFERIKGNIVIQDNGNTIALDDGSKMTITYTDSVGITKSFTSSGSLSIPLNINYLRKNETYTISVYAKVDLQDGNVPIDNCYIGSTIVRTLDTNPFYLTYNVDIKDTTNSFKINARLGDNNSTSSILEANTMSGLIFNLYEGTSTTGTLAKTVRKVDRNLDEYVSELKTDFYDKQFNITPALFNLRNEDLKAEYYTIEVKSAYDYTSYKNEIGIVNNIMTVKTVGFVPSLPSDPNNSMDIKAIRNKDSGAKHRDDLDEETIVGYQVKGIYDNSNKYAVSLNYKLFNSKTGVLVETKKYNVEADGSINYVPFYLSDGTNFNTIDKDFRRGNEYYFTFTVDIDLNQDKIPETTYPANPNIILKSEIQKPNKQEPKILMYPSVSDANSFTWKYKISDIDNSIVENKLYYTINSIPKNPINFIKSPNYELIKFTNIETGFLEVFLKKALQKENAHITNEQLVYQNFDGLYNPPAVKYTIYNDVNRVVISFIENDTLSFFDRVAGAKIVFTADGKTITKDYMQINNGNIVVDYSELEQFLGKNISTEVFLYYDSGITGYDTNSTTTALQMINNNTVDYDGKYYFMNTATSFATNYSAAKSLFNTNLNLVTSKIDVLNLITNKTTSLSISQNKGGISYNYEILMPKVLKKQTGVNTSNPTFTFNKIIPSISLLNDKGTLDISPALVSAKFKVKLFGAGGNRVKDNKIYLDIFKTNDAGTTSEYVNTNTYTIEQLKGVITAEGLTPKTNFYAKIYAYILSGDVYVKENLYDSDFQSNTKNYYFKTLGDVGITNVSAKYEATSYIERKIKLTYNLREIVGYDRIEYKIYKIIKNADGTTTDELVNFNIESDIILSSSMTKYINIPPGCGIVSNEEYRVVIRPYAKMQIGGITEDIELTPNNNTIFSLNKLSEPYVGISSIVLRNNTLEYKVNFYDSSKAVVNDVYQVQFLDDLGTDITPTIYKGMSFDTGASRKFTLPNLVEGKRYTIKILYDINLINELASIVKKTNIYRSTLVATDGISIGNFSVITDLNDNSRMRLLFYDSYKLTDIDTIRYSIYSSSGYSIDGEERFIPITITLSEGIVYYYYTLNTILPSAGQYYLQLQFIKGNSVITEQSIEYNYIK
ncbi:MAG: hypothetical protein RR923_02160 [Bacilli bacterium]